MTQECKECNINKSINDFYKHPQGKNGVLGRCKDCIKKGRKTEREKLMSRKRDKKRYYYNISGRKDYIYSRSKMFRFNHPEKYKAHKKVGSWIRYNKGWKDGFCSLCNKKCQTDLHHEDYNKPEEVHELCRLCHNNVHVGNIRLTSNTLKVIPF